MRYLPLSVPPLEVEILRLETRTVIRCAGEVDVSNIQHLEEALEQGAAGAGTDLELDLREVEFLDSCTLLAVERAEWTLLRAGRRITVYPASFAARLFRMTGLGHLLAEERSRFRMAA